MALRTLHLVGSAQSDFMAELSRLYARDCLQTIEDPRRYEPVIAEVGPDRRWRFPAGLDDASRAAVEPVHVGAAIGHLAGLGIDVVVPHMFCLPGMTEYRSLLDLLGIPFIGNRAATMALGAHKARAKAVVAAAGVDVPRGEVVRTGQATTIAPPAVVKPVDGDNSDGLTFVRDAGELSAAVAAADHGAGALVEEYVALGREVRCGVIERDGDLVALPLEEYAVSEADKPVRDTGDKLRRDDRGQLTLVAKQQSHAWVVDVEDPICAAVWTAARRCHTALGCRHYSLLDFRIDPTGRPWFLEAGLYCSFARQSVVCTMARAAGLDTPELFALAVEAARSEIPHARSAA